MLQILNREAFAAIKKKITYYALNLSSRKWSATKKMADEIEEGKEEEFDFNLEKGCSFSCKLLARYSLPCRY